MTIEESKTSCCCCNKAKNTASKNSLAGKLRTLALWLGAWLIAFLHLEPLSNALTYQMLNLERGTHFAGAIQFFILEVPKVLLLLALVVFVVGILRTFFTPERSRALLVGKYKVAGHFAGASLGIVTPFCTCSAIPLFLGFVESGVPLGVTFSFLIAAPMINEIAIVLLFGMFGFKVAATYIVSGFIVAVFSGWLIEKLKLERFVEDWVFSTKLGGSQIEQEPSSWDTRIEAGYTAVKEIVGKIWLYLVIGIAVGAAIHGYVPTGFMASFMGKSAWWAVPGAVILGVPMYSNAAGIIPIVHALLEKGASLGTALAFMMAVIGLSLPESIILRKVLKLPLVLIFNGIVATGIVIVGYIFNSIF